MADATLWWSWSWRRRLALLAVMLTFSTAAMLAVVRGAPDFRKADALGAILGGISFLTIPQMLGWMLFVGLRTGFMPSRGHRESRADNPRWFWTTAGMYIALLTMFAGSFLYIAYDAMTSP